MNSITTVLALALLSAKLNAAVILTLTESPTSGPTFKTSTLSPVADGSLVRIGTFDALPPANSTFAQLALIFHEFSTTTIGHSGAPNTGRINRAGITGTIGTTGPLGTDDPDSFFVGKKVYIWVFNSTSADPLVDQGVFGSSTATDTFKDQATSFSVSMTHMALGFGTFLPGDATATTSSTASAPGGSLVLGGSPVPEPSSLVFLFVGLVATVTKRRR